MVRRSRFDCRVTYRAEIRNGRFLINVRAFGGVRLQARQHRSPKTSSRSSQRCRRPSPERLIGELSERSYFGSTTTGRSSAQSGGRERLFEMGRHQSAQNARRFSPRRQPAERNRCPSCRHARGRGEPLLWPEVVGAARSSRHPEKPCLCCEGVSRLRPDSILQSWHLSVHQRAMDAVAEAEIRLGKG